MTNLQHSFDFSALIDRWMQQDAQGVQFPVDFDLAWKIAGYSTKQKAKNKLKYLTEGTDFLTNQLKSSTGGRPSHLIEMTCDAFKHFCLLAETEQGRNVRQYFIDAEKKWKLVEQHRPDVASEVEMMQMKIELAKIEAAKESAIAQAKKADLDLVHFRHYVTTALPEPVQQKVLGYSVVKEKEVVETIINSDTGQHFDGVGISYIAKALGFKTTKQCWAWLERHGYGNDSAFWNKEPFVGTTQKLPREHFDYLRHLIKDSGDRQLFLGE